MSGNLTPGKRESSPHQFKSPPTKAPRRLWSSPETSSTSTQESAGKHFVLVY